MTPDSTQLPLLDLPPAAPDPAAPRAPARPPPPVISAATRAAAMPGNSRAALRAWLLAEIFAPAFRPRSSGESVTAWADRSGLPVEGGGRFNSRRKPHCRRFLDTSADPAIREQHVMKASRAGYTQCALVRIAHKTQHDPHNVQFTCGSKEKSKIVNDRRIKPLLKKVGAIGRPDDDPDDASSSLIRLGGMVIRITGAFSKGAYLSDAVGLCINDESEVVTAIEGIGTPADGGRSRIRGIEGAQLLSISRAGEWASPHHIDVATGTLEAYLVPCPHCGTFQELTIDGRSLIDQLRLEEPLREGDPPINPPLRDLAGEPLPRPRLGRLRFDHCKLLPGTDGSATPNPGGWDYERILTETWYECVSGCQIRQDDPLTAADLAAPHCSFTDEVRALHASGHRLTHKQAMMLSGRHLRTNPRPEPADGGGPRSKRSEHNSDLVSLDFDMSWGHLAKIYAKRAHNAADLRNFFNEHLGLPLPKLNSHVAEQALVQCRAPYQRGTIPFVPDYLSLCADTQDHFWKWVCVAGRLDTAGEAWRDVAVVHWGATGTQRPDMVALLDGFVDEKTGQRRPYLTFEESPRAFQVAGGLVDAAGHRTDDVYHLFFDSKNILVPSFGGRENQFNNNPTWLKTKEEQWHGCTFDIAYYRDAFWQARLDSMITEIAKTRHCTEVEQLDPAAKGLPPRLWLPGMPADLRLRDFEKELRNEVLAEGKYVKIGVQDWRDALKLCLVDLDLALPRVAQARALRLAAAAAAKAAPKT